MSECEEIMKENKIVALLHSWLIDDKGRNYFVIKIMAKRDI